MEDGEGNPGEARQGRLPHPGGSGAGGDHQRVREDYIRQQAPPLQAVLGKELPGVVPPPASHQRMAGEEERAALDRERGGDERACPPKVVDVQTPAHIALHQRC